MVEANRTIVGADGAVMPTAEQIAAFRSSPVIERIAGDARWSVSTADKMPLNVRLLLESGRVAGAAKPYEKSCLTLDELEPVDRADGSRARAFSNVAYALDSTRCGLCVLDIEPTCSSERRSEFLEMGYALADTSMSGRGLHLVFEMPTDVLERHPVAATKRVLRSGDGSYEVLLDHWVTFTRRLVEPVSNDAPRRDFGEFLDGLCATQRKSISVSGAVFDMPSAPSGAEGLARELLDVVARPSRDDYGGDESRYEWAWLRSLARGLDELLDIRGDGERLTSIERARVIYDAIVAAIDHRDKHDQLRCGVPLLMYGAVRAQTALENARRRSAENRKSGS